MHCNRDIEKAEAHALAAVDIFLGTSFDYRNTRSLAKVYYLHAHFNESLAILDYLASRKTSIDNVGRT